MSYRFSLISIANFCIGCHEYQIKEVNKSDSGEIETEESLLDQCPTDSPSIYMPETSPDCVEEPIIGIFNPNVEWTWNENPLDEAYNVVEVPPIAINLNDDNADGIINTSDIPDIIFPAFKNRKFNENGHIIALSGATHEPLFVASSDDYPFWGISGIAAGDIERDGTPDIFAVTKFGIMRLDNNGNMIWHVETKTQKGGKSIISLADINADGVSEIIMSGAVIDAGGHILWESIYHSENNRYFGSFAADLDYDGYQEIITSGTVFNHDGSIRWTVEDLLGYPAIGDIDGDTMPEIISSYNGTVTVLDSNGVLVWEVVHGGRSGPPTIADFDGDGHAEIGVASKETYSVLDGDGSLLWSHPIEESSSGMTGSSVFDFEGDGAAEVVYADEQNLWIFDGATGTVEMSWTEHGSGTRFEYPTIVDIDADGSAEILLAGGRDANFGLSVIGSLDNSWAPARKIWNQYAYSITNVNDDGTIPVHPTPNWLTWNSFRAGNSETKVGLELPDLELGEPSICTEACSQGFVEVYFPIENKGLQNILQDVTLYVQTHINSYELETIPFMTAQSVHWIGPYVFSTQEIQQGVVVFVDTPDRIHECKEENNILLWEALPCDG